MSMRSALRVFIISLLLPLTGCAADSDTITLPRRDGASVSIRLFGNWQEDACLPTVVLSHGFGGSEDGLAYIGEALAEQGYRAMTMRHAESGGSRHFFRLLTRSDKARLLTDPTTHAARFMDVEAALVYATRHCTPPFLALGGHSFGAATTMMEAGAKGKITGAASEMGKDRFDAYVALSPQGVGVFYDAGAWSEVHKPVLMVTGTEDGAFDGDYTTRLAAFEGLPSSGNKRLAVIDGASHMNLGGRRSATVRTQVVALMVEFLHQIRTQGKLRPVTHEGIAITDK